MERATLVVAIVVPLVSMVAFGCDDPLKQPPRPTATAALATTDPKQLYTLRCAGCHGSQGKGDGPAAATISPKPRTFSDAEWQRSVSDEHIRTIIVKGGSGVGKSALMPANDDLASQPELVRGLAAHVRSFGK